ncbi:MAG: hypothetical protein RBT22_09580 [Aliarcobacter sp.]|jgi:hypothetical protein|nr:hypothetical protein [Aliarcobacter sp.]
MELGINSILGLQTIFDEDKNEEKKISNIQIAKNIISFRKEINLTKKEFKLFFSFIEKSQILQIN